MSLADEECCTDPGAVAGCWWQDAERDGVTCLDDTECAGGSCNKEVRVGDDLPPNGWGLCECETNVDCGGNGVCRGGLCGPSFCNGYLVCACWGGCTEADAWSHSTPKEACEDTTSGFPGFCCEGSYPSDVTGAGSGYCSDDCPDPEAPECEKDEDCADVVTDPLSTDCVEASCVDGACDIDYINIGEPCFTNMKNPDPLPDWHRDCGNYQCTDDGMCLLQRAAVETECDDDDVCTSLAECDANGYCAPVLPDAAADAECCDPDGAASFDDGNPCTYDSCSDASQDPPFRDTHSNVDDDTSCADGDERKDDDCGVYVCSSGSCVESTGAFENDDCEIDNWTYCQRRACSDQAGQEGVCVPISRREGIQCAWTNEPDTCGRQICQSGICKHELAVGPEEEECIPASGVKDICCEYECNSAHQCIESICDGDDATLEQCPGENLGVLDSAIDATLNSSGSNRCFDDDYDVLTTGFFATCDFANDGEVVYSFTEQTDSSEFILRHTEITVTDDTMWDPVLYTATSCVDSDVEEAEPQAAQYTCSVDASPTVMSGPWPLVDTPTSDVATGYTTANTRTTSIFVDARSRSTAEPSGGDYALSLKTVAHDNSSCVNTADQVQAPLLVGDSSWRQRYLGNNRGHGNYFNTLGLPLTGYCWDGGAAASNDPKFAFFHITMPDGADSMSSGTLSWDHTYKLYTDPAGTEGRMADVLAAWGNNAPNGDCSTGALSSLRTCQNTPLLAPREIVVESGDTQRQGFVSVSNRDRGESGDYELNLLRVPRPFVGLSQQFLGPGDGAGCSCGISPDGWSLVFDLGGNRLDFIPTNDDVKGYAVRKSDFSDDETKSRSWLVDDEGTKICEGMTCASPSVTTPFDMEFQFPYAGDVWSKFCVDAAGRIILAKNSTDCVNKWDKKPNTDEFLTGADPELSLPVTPAIAPLWGSIVPCNQFSKPGCSILGFWKSGGDLKCDNDWLCWNGCSVWEWRGTSCSGSGEIRKSLTVFEGTTAMVVTWEGFDGYFNPRNGGEGHTIDFKVILRVDGRITFFYKMPVGGTADWNTFIDMNGWIVGLSGGRSQSCETDEQCNSAFGTTTGLSCDKTTYTVDGREDDPVWEARFKCVNSMDLQSSGDIPVPGSWQGE